MNPVFFHVQWEQLGESLAMIVVLALFLERALSIVFENRWFVGKPPGPGGEDGRTKLQSILWNSKEIIAFLAAYGTCWYIDFDALAIITQRDLTGWPGQLITAAIIAGGSKGSVKLFRDFLNIRSGAYQEYEDVTKKKARPSKDPPPDPKDAKKPSNDKPQPRKEDREYENPQV